MQGAVAYRCDAISAAGDCEDLRHRDPRVYHGRTQLMLGGQSGSAPDRSALFLSKHERGDERHLDRRGDAVHRKKQSITGDTCCDHGLFGQSIVQIKSKNPLESTMDLPRIGLVFVLIEIRELLAS